MSSTSFDDFLSIQSTWKTEIQEQFLKFKREESVSFCTSPHIKFRISRFSFVVGRSGVPS